MKPRRPWGAANCETVVTFVGSWVAQRNGVIRRPELGLAVPESCVLGGQARWCQMQTRKWAPRSRGLRTAKPRPHSSAPGGPKEWCHTQTKQNEASPSLGAANCETFATFVSSCEAQRPEGGLAVPGGRELRNCRTFVGPWVVQRSGVIRRSECGLAAPEGCELRNCRWFRWLLGGPTEWCHKHIRMRPRWP